MKRRIRGTTRELDQAAREMRGNLTPAEAALWEQLRLRRFHGLQFRRQHAVGRFVLDFYCAACKLAIEVDGEYHDHQRERDAERDAILTGAGYTVLRFRNEEVFHNLPSVLARIATALHEG